MMANEINQGKTQTREAHKSKKQTDKQLRRERIAEKKAGKPIRIRLIPIWLRILIFVILLAGSIAGGLIVGYGIIGDQDYKDVFQKETWTHIIDLVTENK